MVPLPLLLLELSQAIFHGHVSSIGRRPTEREEHIHEGKMPILALAAANSPPKSFDWRNVNGVNFVTSDVNQRAPPCPRRHALPAPLCKCSLWRHALAAMPYLHPSPNVLSLVCADIPTYCGSCWIHGTVSALNDRIKILRSARFPDVMLSRQAVMNCVPATPAKGEAPGPPPGCGGGDPWMIHDYILDNPVPDETCQPYEARNDKCDALGVCRNCFPTPPPAGAPISGGCWGMPPASFLRFGIAQHGKVSGEEAMQAEIYARGPIVCSIAADMRFLFNYSTYAALNEGVYVDPVKHTFDEVDHDVSVSGWGTTPGGVKYWIVRNSWGTYCARAV